MNNVDDYEESARLLAATTLRNVLGNNTLGEILSERESIARAIKDELEEVARGWGVVVERVEVKDCSVPMKLQRSLAAEAEAAREARAKVIVAEGEIKASLALREAAENIAGSPESLQLRFLQTLSSISAENNDVVMFPLPIELIAQLKKGGKVGRGKDKDSAVCQKHKKHAKSMFGNDGRRGKLGVAQPRSAFAVECEDGGRKEKV